VRTHLGDPQIDMIGLQRTRKRGVQRKGGCAPSAWDGISRRGKGVVRKRARRREGLKEGNE